jgi:aspartate racemase
MSWVSTGMYYDRINRIVQRRVGEMASAPLLVESLDFRALAGLREPEDWIRAAATLSDSARRLEATGAEALLICANSMHKIYDEVAEAVDIPLLHIADHLGDVLREAGHTRAAIIGTRNVMTESWYRKRLVAQGVDLLPPDVDNVETLDRIIYEELMLGKVTRDAERAMRTIITNKSQEGADSIILACTELALVVDVDANVLPVFDSTRIHCRAAVDWMLAGDGEV